MPKAPVLFLASAPSLAGCSSEPAGGQAASAVAPAPAAPAARPAADFQLSLADALDALAEYTRLRAQAAR